MQRKQRKLRRGLKRKIGPIKTTFFELLGELTLLTKDDALVMAVLKQIFASHKVRFGRELAPARLADPRVSYRLLRTLKQRSAWA